MSAQRLGEDLRVGALHEGQNRKFFAAPAVQRRRVRQLIGDGVTECFQNMVARLMSERVVDALEFIKVEHDQTMWA